MPTTIQIAPHLSIALRNCLKIVFSADKGCPAYPYSNFGVLGMLFKRSSLTAANFQPWAKGENWEAQPPIAICVCAELV